MRVSFARWEKSCTTDQLSSLLRMPIVTAQGVFQILGQLTEGFWRRLPCHGECWRLKSSFPPREVDGCWFRSKLDSEEIRNGWGPANLLSFDCCLEDGLISGSVQRDAKGLCVLRGRGARSVQSLRRKKAVIESQLR